MNKIYTLSLLTYLPLSLLYAAECNKLKIMSYNICTLFQTYDTPLDIKYRMPKILDQISAENPDILVLQEARKIEADTIKEKLEYVGYNVLLFSVNDTSLAATLITAYRKKQFTCKKLYRWWYNHENPAAFGGNNWYKWGRILTATTLCKSAYPQGKSVTVCNTHLGLHKDEKTFSIQLALQLLESNFKDSQLVWCGDFNFFEDDGGAAHRALITNAGFHDALESLVDTNGNPLAGTFVGYSVDKCAPKNKKSLSRLDGIFTKKVSYDKTVCLVGADLADDLSNRDELPSDHLPVVVSIED